MFTHPLNEAGEFEYSSRNEVFRPVWVGPGVLLGLLWFLEFGGLLGMFKKEHHSFRKATAHSERYYATNPHFPLRGLAGRNALKGSGPFKP